MSEEEWFDASPEKMAQHISLDGPKTDYQKEVSSFRKNADKLQEFWLDRIDSMDPALGQDVTSAFMDTQKTAARIKFLEKKVEAESQGFDQIDQYEQDKMVLDNLKSQQADDAKQQSDLPEVANLGYQDPANFEEKVTVPEA